MSKEGYALAMKVFAELLTITCYGYLKTLRRILSILLNPVLKEDSITKINNWWVLINCNL